MLKLPSFFAVLGLLASAHATELMDLGQGLAYLRVHSVAESEGAFRKVVPGAGALVLDLRYATIGDESTEALKSALATHAAGTPVFVLLSSATPAALATVVTQSTALTLGAPGSASKVVVQTDTDRRAYDALESGTPLATLLSGKIEKDRFDEATLVKEFKNGNPDAEPPPPPDPTAPKSGTAEKPAPLTDRVLQRAVHLHRALLALKIR